MELSELEIERIRRIFREDPEIEQVMIPSVDEEFNIVERHYITREEVNGL